MDGVRLFASAAVALGLAACPSESDPAPRPEEGDFCITGSPLCSDPETALVCIDSVLVAESCPDECIAMGDPFVDGACTFAGCLCELEDPDGCSPLVSECISQTELGACSLEQEPFIVDCEQNCADQGFVEYARCELVKFQEATCFCG